MSKASKRPKRPSVKDEPINVDELAEMSNMEGMLSFLDTKPEVYAKLFHKINDIPTRLEAEENKEVSHSTDTVADVPTETVAIDRQETVAVESIATVVAGATTTVAVDPATIVVAEPAETVADEPRATGIADPTATVADGFAGRTIRSAATVTEAPKETVTADPTATVIDGPEKTEIRPAATVSDEPRAAVAVEPIGTVVDELEATTTRSTATVAADPKATVVTDPAATVSDGSKAPAVDLDATVAGGSKAALTSPTATVVVGSPTGVVTASQERADLGPTTIAGEPPVTVATAATPHRDPSTTTVTGEPTDTVVAGISTTVAAGLWQAENNGPLFPGSRVRRIVLAQDALTHIEEAVYDALWGPKNTSKDTERICCMGYSELSKIGRVTRLNARLIVDRLRTKGFLEIHTLADIHHRTPTKYRVFSYRVALDNMARQRRTHVVRTGNGVVFVHQIRPTITVVVDPAATVAPGKSTTASAGERDTVRPPVPTTVSPDQSATVAAAATQLGTTSKTPELDHTSSAPPIIATAIINAIGFVDDDALKTLVKKCREGAPDATDEEIAELGVMTARRISRMRNVDNHIGLLISQTAKCFRGEPLAIYRREKAERERHFAALMAEEGQGTDTEST